MRVPFVHRWAVRSHHEARRNAMTATTAQARRRIERDEAQAYVAARARRRTAGRPGTARAVAAIR